MIFSPNYLFFLANMDILDKYKKIKMSKLNLQPLDVKLDILSIGPQSLVACNHIFRLVNKPKRLLSLKTWTRDRTQVM